MVGWVRSLQRLRKAALKHITVWSNAEYSSENLKMDVPKHYGTGQFVTKAIPKGGGNVTSSAAVGIQ